MNVHEHVNVHEIHQSGCYLYKLGRLDGHTCVYLLLYYQDFSVLLLVRVCNPVDEGVCMRACVRV